MNARAGLYFLLLFVLACSRLPSYARPQGSLTPASAAGPEDLISYRKLTRADFKGKAPAGEAAAHTDAMGAVTYTTVRPDPNLEIWITDERKPNGEVVYSGQLSKTLHFRAQMDRLRSWWNPKLKETPEAYVLQHEQIHFAIVAVEARKLNAEAPALTAKMHATGSSPAEVRQAIEAKINGVIKAALAELLDENLRFDEDTSGRYEPKKQNEWYERVTAKLAKH